MADTKISALTSATLPLSGSELVPIVQSGTTVKTAISNIASNQPPTPYTANGVVYASSTSALTTGTALVFDGANLGLGVTPSAWGTGSGGYKAINIGTYGAAYDYETSGAVGLASNCYATASNWIYTQSYGASRFESILGQHRWYTAPSGTAGNAITFTQAMTLDASGNLLVGKTAQSVSTTGLEITQGGVIRSTVADSTNASLTNIVYSSTAAAYRFYVGLAGTVYATSTTITAISDQRLKENIRDLDEGLATVMALKPRKFDWKEGKGQNIKNARGFIAQEFETVLPDMIEEWRDPAPEGEEAYKAINANLIPVLVKAIQELSAQVTSLTTRLTALENK